MSFVAQAAIENDVAGRLGLAKRVVAVRNTRQLRKADMLHNAACPQIRVDTQTFQVFADGELATCEPAQRLSLTQRYMLR
jgi:urease subunit alpha